MNATFQRTSKQKQTINTNLLNHVTRTKLFRISIDGHIDNVISKKIIRRHNVRALPPTFPEPLGDVHIDLLGQSPQPPVLVNQNTGRGRRHLRHGRPQTPVPEMAHVPLKEFFQFWPGFLVTPQMESSWKQEIALDGLLGSVADHQSLAALPDVIESGGILEGGGHHVVAQGPHDKVH